MAGLAFLPGSITSSRVGDTKTRAVARAQSNPSDLCEETTVTRKFSQNQAISRKPCLREER
jgi:hypothetical protein